MYTGPQLIQLLEKQHAARNYPGLFKKGTFTIQWRAKVGSFPHPDLETIVSAGEPCGAWRPQSGRPEDKRNVGENWEHFHQLPLNGYIPGSGIRGLVRSWAKQRPEIASRMRELLGDRDGNCIVPGKIEFLDAWPEKATKLTLDIVNPQESFQIYHQGQSTPLSFYTLGNGEDAIEIAIAIRGSIGKATAADVEEVWGWVQEALALYGVGSRTASGYGAIASPEVPKPTPDPGYSVKRFDFTLYSQGCYGVTPQELDLRPSHWRGWLRSWVLRFLLGVMSKANAEQTLAELLGILEPRSYKGCVRLQMTKGAEWGECAEKPPTFYLWKGQLQLTAPKDILNKILLPILKFAVMVGGIGHGWRRPLHIFAMANTARDASRGTYLHLTHRVKKSETDRWQNQLFGLSLNESTWMKTYEAWQIAVQQRWPDRYQVGQNPNAEVFSPTTCAVYSVPGPQENPLDRESLEWTVTKSVQTRGCGMDLIYQPQYKRKPDVGGDAAGGNNAHCSWVSIKRVNIPNQAAGSDCQEVVCLFMGGQTPQANHLRSQFLKDLAQILHATHLFGVQPPDPRSSSRLLNR